MSGNGIDPALTRRGIVFGGLMVAAAGGALALHPGKRHPALSKDEFEAQFPTSFGPWRYLSAAGLITPPADDLTRYLYQNLLTRVYRSEADGRIAMLLIAYSNIQEGDLQVHRPEICYPAAGFEIVMNQPHDIAVNPALTLPGRFIEAGQAGRRERLIYWTRVQDDFPLAWVGQRIAMARTNLGGMVADGVLVRVSMMDQSATAAMLDDFARAFIAAAGAGARRILLGPRLGASIRLSDRA